MRQDLGLFSAIFGKPAERWEKISARFDGFLNGIFDRLDASSFPMRLSLAEEWAGSKNPEPGTYIIHGVRLVRTASGNTLFD